MQIFCASEATLCGCCASYCCFFFFLTPHPTLCACVLTSVCLRCAGAAGCLPRLITTLIPAPCFCFFFLSSFFSSTPRFSACVEVVWAPSGLPHHRSMPDPVIQLSICVIDFFLPPHPHPPPHPRTSPPIPSLFVEFHLSSTFLRSDGEGGASEGAEI